MNLRPLSSASFRYAAVFLAAARLASPAALPAGVYDFRNQGLVPTTWISDGMNFGGVLAVGDFNGDHRQDLVIASPDAEGATVTGAGKVEVRFGTSAGLAETPGVDVVGTKLNEHLGLAIAAGDFDGNGKDELAIGVPLGELSTAPGLTDVGRVEIYLWVNGSWSHVQSWSQDVTDIHGAAESGDRFGGALASGDFNGDGRDDLAIGVPGEAVGDIAEAGAINVLFGGASGLSAAGNQLWYRSSGISGDAEEGAHLGQSLAAGNFNGVGPSDLAIGAPGATTASFHIPDGSVSVLYGYPGLGLIMNGQQTIDRQMLNQLTGDFDAHFGETLAAGDLDRSSWCIEDAECADDLVIGAPLADDDTENFEAHAGAVFQIYGSQFEEGLDLDSARFTNARLTGGWAYPSENQRFGEALAVGSIGGTEQAAVAIGMPRKTDNFQPEWGCVELGLDLDRWAPRINNPDAQFLYLRGVYETYLDEPEMRFGSAVAIGDFDGDGSGDIAVGVPGFTTMAPFVLHGGVQILYGAIFASDFESGGTAWWGYP